MPSRPLTYAEAGVDIAAADTATHGIRELARRTFDSNVLTGIGAFGAVYALVGRDLRDPVLVSSADGVGTKLKVAFLTDRHNTVGQCLVNHCVNDIAVQGATPLFFLDYLSIGKLRPGIVEELVEGVSTACVQNGVSLIGGETAEMPGMYQPGEYDLAGFIVGIADRSQLLMGTDVVDGSALLGLPSTGLHTNGYSLARKVFLEIAGYTVDDHVDELGRTVGEELLAVHRSYLRPLGALTKAGLLSSAAHITGGGITDNTPRMLPEGLQARIDLGSWNTPTVFQMMQRIGGIEDAEMRRAFNMGIGMIACVPPGAEAAAVDALRAVDEPAIVIGRVEQGTSGVVYAE